MRALSFDFGQTLAEFDHEMLARRVAERGAELEVSASVKSFPDAMRIYGESKALGHELAWRAMMSALLSGSGVPAALAAELSAWLWSEQPRKNLWRRPIPGMIELIRELRRSGLPVAIVSNSEGYLAELVAELAWSADFDLIVDSGRVGFAKPDPRIFLHACSGLQVEPGELLHVGDAWHADVEGAVGAGARAVWFDLAHQSRRLPVGVHGAGSAAELREVLAGLGVLR